MVFVEVIPERFRKALNENVLTINFVEKPKRAIG